MTIELPPQLAPSPFMGYGHDSNEDGRIVRIAYPNPALTYNFYMLASTWPETGGSPWQPEIAPELRGIRRDELNLGIYRHYKKKHLYQVLGLGIDGNNFGRIVVVYIGLELDEAHKGPRLAIRTFADFLAHVHANGALADPDDPTSKPRFTYIGQSWEGRGGDIDS